MPLALIVGASSGVGAATARELARRGWTVVLTARSEAPLAALADEIGPAASHVAADAATPEGIATVAAVVRERHGVPDVVVNSAGIGAWTPLAETPPEQIRRMIEAPYLTAANASQAFLGEMLARGRGVLIHVNSPAGFMPWPGAVGYASARFALRGLHEALRQDLAGTGVASCHVVLGRVDSAYFARNGVGEERIPRIGETIRTLSVEECGRVLADVAERPVPLRVHPPMLRLYVAAHRVAPGLVRWLLRATMPAPTDRQ